MISDDIKKRLVNDRSFFFRKLLPHYIKTAPPVGELHAEWFQLLDTHDKLILVAPRGHSKSSIITVADNLFDICNQNEKYIMILSDTPEQAKDHLGNIVEELETNTLLMKLYGQLYKSRRTYKGVKDKWTDSEIITTTGIKIVAKGWRLKTRGMRFQEVRPTKIVIDDVESDESVSSELMRTKLKNVFNKKILNLGSFDTKIRMVGTILHFDSLLQNELDKPRPEWFVKAYTAIKKDGTALWPEWWTLDKLEKKREEIGDLAFEQEFMNNPIDPSTQILKPTAFYESIDLSMCECYGYIDLAISEKETADYTAIVTIAREKNTGKLYIIDPVRLKGDVHAQMDLVIQQHELYKYQAFGIEVNQYQKAFAQWIQSESAKRNIYIPIVEVTNDKDKVRRAQEIAPYIENGTVIFNQGHQAFMAEVVQFPKASHDDWVDALIGAIKLVVEHSSGSIRTGKKTSYPKNI